MKNNHTNLNPARRITGTGTWSARGATLLAAILCLLGAFAAQAATVTWTNTTDYFWGNPANWDSAAVPGAADDVLFNTNAVVADATTNNFVDSNYTIDSLSYMQTNPSPAYHNTYIDTGWRLGVYNTATANAMFVGAGADVPSGVETRATMSGPGTFSVVASNGVFNVRNGGLYHYNGLASLNMSALSNSTITVSRLLVAGDGSNALDSNGGRLADRPQGELYLAQANTLNILASSSANPPGLTLGYTVGNAPNLGAALYLGQTNYIYSDSGMGIGLDRIPTMMSFNPAFSGSSPYAYFRNVARTGYQNQWLVGDSSLVGSWGLGAPTTSTADLTAGTIDALVNQLVVGRSINTIGVTGNAVTGTLSFNDGTLQVNTATIGYQMLDWCASVVGTVNVGCTAKLIVNTTMQLGRFMGADSTNGLSSAILNINGGQVFVTNSITTTTSALNPNNDSEINITSPGDPCSNGWLYVKGSAMPLVGPLYQLNLGSGTTLTFDLGASVNPSAPLCSVSNLITSPTVTLAVIGSALDLGSFQVIK